MLHNDYFSRRPEQYVSEVNASIEMSENLSKPNTEKRIVEPFFQLLGWPLSVPEEDCSVELDYEVAKNDTVDYAFVLDDKPVVFVKTISFDDTLPSEVAVETELENGFNWGVLTNGKDYEFYRMIDEEVDLVESVTLDDMTSKKDFLTYMTLPSLRSGRTSTESEDYDSSVVDRRNIYSETSEMSDRLVSTVETIEDDNLRSEVDKLEDSLDRLLGFDDYFHINESSYENNEDHSGEQDDEVEHGEDENVRNDGTTDSVKDGSEDLRSFDSSVHEDDDEVEDEEVAEGKLQEESSSESSNGSSDDSSDDNEGGLSGLFSIIMR